ncbi:MAG: hypothetical protein ACI9CE_003167 [Flavobacterium sp.]|jgi:hypothetical protein
MNIPTPNENGVGDENPSGTASSGHYRDHDRVVYWREEFN